MSSPRRAAKDALDRAAKAARGSRPAVPAAKTSAKIAVADAKRVTAAIERSVADGKLDTLPAETLQALIAAADVMVTASGLLRAADLAAFELGMWQGWTGR